MLSRPWIPMPTTTTTTAAESKTSSVFVTRAWLRRAARRDWGSCGVVRIVWQHMVASSVYGSPQSNVHAAYLYKSSLIVLDTFSEPYLFLIRLDRHLTISSSSMQAAAIAPSQMHFRWLIDGRIAEGGIEHTEETDYSMCSRDHHSSMEAYVVSPSVGRTPEEG